MREPPSRVIMTNMGVDILYYVDHDLPTDCAQSFWLNLTSAPELTANGELLAVGLTVRWKSNFQIQVAKTLRRRAAR